VGARYYTSIGPIRLDVAVPVNRTSGGDAFELYIGLGEAF
jgi:translocation and assembly module TamA